MRGANNGEQHCTKDVSKHRKCGPVNSARPLVCYSGYDLTSGYSTSLLKHFVPISNETGCNVCVCTGMYSKGACNPQPLRPAT